MIRVWHVAMAVGGLAMGGGSIASEAQWWRPVMPAVRIDVAEAGVPTPTLVLIYGEGRELYGPGVAGDQITSCQTLAGTCNAVAGHSALHLAGSSRQSLQVRWLNGDGRPVISGVTWQGSVYPTQVDLRCDLAASDPRKACALVRVHA
ncbi:hypothetical protein [Sphingomonas sp. S2-65]|uniref:hypothetical protein n=1 Tax=Sphingomonas sp. S2-65 TaxID=2903960 RepID=UPI001F3B8B6B|nr:hypothetical protein [Sphingomonas sp. S2-65]UYY58859.1 hypothetical protein LZ586_01740 [Sphingomonas sp. S2-65]